MSFNKISALAGVLSLAASVAAHGHVRGITVDGNWVGGFELAYAYGPSVPDNIGWSTTALDNGFVEPNKFSTSDIACHLGGKTGASFATVAAGSSIKVSWDTWPDSHKGPVLDYLAPYAESAADLKFFKFAEEGLVDGKWAADKVNAASNFTWTVTIPSDVAPGKYVYRHEIIALHGAGSENGAQAYPQCLNLEITGSGTVKPAGVAASALYKTTDPGILVSIYNGLTSYIIPGPAVYSGSGSAPAPAPAPSSAPAPTVTSAPVPTSAPEETAAPAPTSSKSKSACKPKTKTPLPTAIPTGAPATPEYPEESAPSVPTTPEEEYPEETAAPETPAPSTPATPSPAGELPADTKLSSVLSWLSKFYAAHGQEFDSETALRRRHARQF